ncbi:hypothetical protein QNI19_13285 [Cytophagaceae bacterium DM2B3-1]|uniref:Uncharacterized protein n=1 Tax=Xanthocytophaga flava TaxID=3048013 RepID=A0AAE3U5M1_9BACT|nr:hypothetical protein [Xanthocytophaga flavus]MDJ1479672.1 hypothetical protein [Xanthocytophaga flavus]MDJ1493910.1 hypothetical protein [Xanthocytophaga flavus]
MPWDIIAIPAILALVFGFLNGKKVKDKLAAQPVKKGRHGK